LAERQLYTLDVTGSNPVSPTILKAITMKNKIKRFKTYISQIYYVNGYGRTIKFQKEIDVELRRRGLLWPDFPFVYNGTPFWKFYLHCFLEFVSKKLQHSIDLDLNKELEKEMERETQSVLQSHNSKR
jgi:hypothetical protein